MTQPQCDGTEKHYHFSLDTEELVWHSHGHSVMEKEFNRLHHHPPMEHSNFSEKVLNDDVERTKVPW